MGGWVLVGLLCAAAVACLGVAEYWESDLRSGGAYFSRPPSAVALQLEWWKDPRYYRGAATGLAVAALAVAVLRLRTRRCDVPS